jgi:hypothetical protein
MPRFVLIPGAGGAGWYWHRVVALLEDAGAEAVAVDLPADDESAGLPEYAAVVVDAIGDGDAPVLVAQSLGGFTAPLVCAQTPVAALVLVNAMIPVPGETAAQWGDNVGSSEARQRAADAGGYTREFDLETYFFHDVPNDLVAAGEPYQHEETDAAFQSVCDFAAWPGVAIRVLVGADDRLFPADFQRRIARDRLGVEADVLPGGHLIALSDPAAVAHYLLAP